MTGSLIAALLNTPPVQSLFPEGVPLAIILRYGVDRSSCDDLIGLPMTVAAAANCYNDRIQALSIVLPTWMRPIHPHPHIVISWVKGSNPLDAAVMLSGDHEREDVGGIVHTIVEWQEWGEMPIALCSVCGVQKLRRDNKTGICAQCQPRTQKNSKYRARGMGDS